MFVNRKTNRRKTQRGFTLAEVALAMIVFLMMTLMYAAVFPVAIRAAHYSNDYAQAALLAQHKIDQLRSAGVGKLDYTDLTNLGIVDINTQATGPSYTFTGVDNLGSNGSGNQSGFFPTGTTGTITIVDDSTLSNVSNPPPVGEVNVATVSITWPGAGTTMASYTTTAMIVSMVHE